MSATAIAVTLSSVTFWPVRYTGPADDSQQLVDPRGLQFCPGAIEVSDLIPVGSAIETLGKVHLHCPIPVEVELLPAADWAIREKTGAVSSTPGVSTV